MTTTTGELARAVARAYARPLALAAVLLWPAAARADWTFSPSIGLRGTYTDNLTLAPEGLEQSQFVKEVTPGFTLRHKGPRLVVNSSFQQQFYSLKDDNVPGTNRSARQLSADAKAMLADELLFVDATASISRQGISPFGQQATDSNYAWANRAEVRSYSVSPYLINRFSTRASSELRYKRDGVDAGTSGLGNSTGDTLSWTLASGSAFRTLGWNMHLRHQRIEDDLAGQSRNDTAGVSLRYRYTGALSLTAGGGYDKYDYQALGGSNRGAYWSGGVAWTPSLRTSITATLGKRFYGTSKSLAAMHRSRHSVWNLSYSDGVTSTRANFLLPATIDTATMLDRMFLPTIPDPDARARAVEDYIRLAGLPPSLASSINYFSNRYSLQKQLQASAAYNLARTTLLVSVSDTRRTALSDRASDSVLLGNPLSLLNDDVRQSGVRATLTYRLSPRSNVILGSDAYQSKSSSLGVAVDTRAARLSLLHRLGNKLTGALELRHLQGETLANNGRPYSENALSASLNLKF